MALSDHKYVNFSEAHEINYHLEKVNKEQSLSNRIVISLMEPELKQHLRKTFVTHDELHSYLLDNLDQLS